MAVSPVLWLLLFALSAGSTRSPRDLNDDAEKYLLPWNIRPEHYDLTLFPQIEKFDTENEDSFRFSGISEITALVLYGDVEEIVLHTHDSVAIVSSQVTSLDIGGPLNYTVTVGKYDAETNKQSLLVSPALSNNGRYRITVYYTGINSDSLRGFYRSSYQDTDGTTRWLLTTHFESFGARQAFPCFDEPEYKATYKLTIHYNQTLAQNGYRAFFNSEIESEAIINGVHVTTFKTTPRPLSSYLVAFILAPFSESPEPDYFNSSFNGENAKKPLWTIGQPKFFSPKRNDRLSQVAGPAALNQMTKFTGVGFGMDKVHQAGIPDFGPGAMENWGLVTYREVAVFWDNETGTTSQKQSVVSTSTHELAHQWFGDLVTLHWWTDVWLNEGFATYFATHASNEFREPELDTSDWNLIGKFVSGTLHGALKTDGVPTSRALTAEAYVPDVIDRYFDGISYDKGGSVLRMWANILSPDNFYAGLNRYLRQQEESVGTPEILLASWDGIVDSLPEGNRPNLGGLSVAELFRAWHRQAGYPVVNVARNGATLTLTQKRFLASSGDDSPRWNVPITYSTSQESNFNNTSPSAYLLAADKSIDVKIANANADWVVINNQQTGFYRVNYDSENWDKLIAIANDPQQYDQIHEYNRAQILDDADALGASTHEEYLPANTVLRLLPMIKHDRSLTVWRTAIRVMNGMLQRIKEQNENQNIYVALQSFFSELVLPTFAELTLYTKEADSDSVKLLRSAVGELACQLEVQSCLQQAVDLYRLGVYHPDVRKVVLCEGVKQGGEVEWTRSYEVAVGEESPVQMDHIHALTCTNDHALLDRLLELLPSTKTFKRDSDVRSILEYLLQKHPSKASSVLRVIESRRWKNSNHLEKLNIMALTHVSSQGKMLRSYESTSEVSEKVMEELKNQNLWTAHKLPQLQQWMLL